MKITYSADARHYYITDDADPVNQPRSWVAVDSDADGKTEVMPFAFWKVRSGDESPIKASDPLVARYQRFDGWALPPGAKWRGLAERILVNAEASLKDAEQTATYYRTQCDLLRTALASHV